MLQLNEIICWIIENTLTFVLLCPQVTKLWDCRISFPEETFIYGSSRVYEHAFKCRFFERSVSMSNPHMLKWKFPNSALLLKLWALFWQQDPRISQVSLSFFFLLPKTPVCMLPLSKFFYMKFSYCPLFIDGVLREFLCARVVNLHLWALSQICELLVCLSVRAPPRTGSSAIKALV